MSYIAEFVVVLQIRRFLRSLIKTVGGRNFTKHVTFHGFAVLVTIFSVTVVQEDMLWSLSNDAGQRRGRRIIRSIKTLTKINLAVT